MSMTRNSRNFNDLLDKEVARRVKELDKDGHAYDNEPYAAHYLMEDLAYHGEKVVLDGKPVENVWVDGGPGLDLPKWQIVVRWDGDLYYADEWFSSYDLSELGVFHEAESYVEPVTKYRKIKA